MKVEGKTEEEDDAGGEGVGILREECFSGAESQWALQVQQMQDSSGEDEASLCPAQLPDPIMEGCPSSCSLGVESLSLPQEPIPAQQSCCKPPCIPARAAVHTEYCSGF